MPSSCYNDKNLVQEAWWKRGCDPSQASAQKVLNHMESLRAKKTPAVVVYVVTIRCLIR